MKLNAPLSAGARYRLSEVAEWLEAGAPERAGCTFNMENFGVATPCGTAVCIGGALIEFRRRFDFRLSDGPWSVYLRPVRMMTVDDAAFLAGKLLEPMELAEYEELFFAHGWASQQPYEGITPVIAGRVVRALITTNEITWDQEWQSYLAANPEVQAWEEDYLW